MNNQKRKLRKNPFTMASKRIKCFDVNLSMEMKDWYTKTTKCSLKNLKKT